MFQRGRTGMQGKNAGSRIKMTVYGDVNSKLNRCREIANSPFVVFRGGDPVANSSIWWNGIKQKRLRAFAMRRF